jgi:formylglycine-generating enzyme required for sulfatase activity/uncharacterized caspase-like protein
LLALLLPASHGQGSNRRVALVVGNGQYAATTPLPNPVRDAELLSASLQRVGFEVQTLRNAPKAQMERELLQFARRAQGASVALVYFAGHGLQMEGRNYVLPVDVKLEDDMAVSLESIELNQLLRVVQGASTRLVVLDACRNNPFAARMRMTGATRSISRGLARVDTATRGTLIAFSTSPDDVAADGSGQHSPFAQSLAKHITQPGLEIRQVFTRVRADVLAQTGERQIPWENSSLLGDLYLAGAAGNPMATVVPERVQPGLDLSDLSGQAGQEAERQRREQAALARMQADFDTVTGFTGTAALQVQAWERFLAAWPVGNAPGASGQALRALAEQRLVQARGQATPPPAQLAAVTSAGGKACPECPETVLIQPGSFQMGSPGSEAGRSGSEGPVRTVRIGYRLAVGKTPITRGEFAAFVNANGYRTEAERGEGCVFQGVIKTELRAGSSWRNPGFEQTSSHPVVCVSWNDVQAYVRWLNDKSPVKGWRLLTEAEHEYAARAGTSSPFWWGADSGNSQQCRFANGFDQSHKRSVPTLAMYASANCDDGHAYTAPVGSFQPNAWGLHDMSGNANSWTQDCYSQNYDGAPTDGSAVSFSGCSLRVLRGGSWRENGPFVRSAYRNAGSPAGALNTVGFRLARTVP